MDIHLYDKIGKICDDQISIYKNIELDYLNNSSSQC